MSHIFGSIYDNLKNNKYVNDRLEALKNNKFVHSGLEVCNIAKEVYDSV